LTSSGSVSTTAFVVTSRPERYIKQLVSHFGNKVKTELTDEGGQLEFDFGTCDLKAVPTGIELIGTAEDPAQLETLKDVVARHLVRLVRMINSASPGLLRVGSRSRSFDELRAYAVMRRRLVVGAGGVALLVVGRGGVGFGC
jgi:hypothetical protein